jgi:hypothetical protein
MNVVFETEEYINVIFACEVSFQFVGYSYRI